MNRTPLTLRNLAIALLAVAGAWASTAIASPSGSGDATPDHPQAVRSSSVEREVVRAEAIEARRLGLIVEGEAATPLATPAQLAQIAAAGRAAAMKLAAR
jgi:hypothetical protein